MFSRLILLGVSTLIMERCFNEVYLHLGKGCSSLFSWLRACSYYLRGQAFIPWSGFPAFSFASVSCSSVIMYAPRVE